MQFFRVPESSARLPYHSSFFVEIPPAVEISICSLILIYVPSSPHCARVIVACRWVRRIKTWLLLHFLSVWKEEEDSSLSRKFFVRATSPGNWLKKELRDPISFDFPRLVNPVINFPPVDYIRRSNADSTSSQTGLFLPLNPFSRSISVLLYKIFISSLVGCMQLPFSSGIERCLRAAYRQGIREKMALSDRQEGGMRDCWT